MVRRAQEGTREAGPAEASGLATFSFAKPKEAPAGSLEGASESSLCSVLRPTIPHSEPLLPAPGSLPHCWSAGACGTLSDWRREPVAPAGGGGQTLASREL